jgi:RNA polymerase sigma factor (TIGR02999 family)
MAPLQHPGEITILLQQWRDGSKAAEAALFKLVMPNLLRLAHNRLKGERPGHSLDTIGLVNEAYIRLVKANDRVDWRNRSHFFAISARVMRRYLIDEWKKRPKADFMALDSDLIARGRDLDTEIEVDRLLEELAEVNAEWCTVVELKHYLGLTDEEAADAMGLPLRTMQHRWHDGRKWLFQRLNRNNDAQ